MPRTIAMLRALARQRTLTRLSYVPMAVLVQRKQILGARGRRETANRVSCYGSLVWVVDGVGPGACCSRFLDAVTGSSDLTALAHPEHPTGRLATSSCS